MINIHLKRIGKSKSPNYRIVVADTRFPRDGRFVDAIGSYDPRGLNLTIIDVAKFDAWVKKGAKPTPRVANILDDYRNNRITGKVLKKDETAS
ncbi:MAG: 30S ribosomal protein S16 [bacterium]